MKRVDSLVGMQWGSEGKGKVIAHLAKEYNAVVRSGGPQAGHTFYDVAEEKHVLRQIPCGVINDDCLLFITAGGLINLDVIRKELSRYTLYPDRLMIDHHTMVVTEHHVEEEKHRNLEKRIASTTEGVGAAQVDKVWRTGLVFDHFANNDPELYFFCGDTAKHLFNIINDGGIVLLEGTQGFGLSLNHGSYPYCTSRDVTSSALLSDAGIAPKHHGQTIGVMRTYPIRVGGNSGPAGNSKELTWEIIQERAGFTQPFAEYTTVTGRMRRVFEQDWDVLKRSIIINGIDQIALMFIDYINAEDSELVYWSDLSSKSRAYIDHVEDELNVPVTMIGTGPLEYQMIDRREHNRKPIRIRYEDRVKYGFKDNFMGFPWSSGYMENFINRKMFWKEKIEREKLHKEKDDE